MREERMVDPNPGFMGNLRTPLLSQGNGNYAADISHGEEQKVCGLAAKKFVFLLAGTMTGMIVLGMILLS